MCAAWRSLACLAVMAVSVWAGRLSGAEPQGGHGAGAQEKVTLQVAKYPELIGAIKALRGKVVVVDVWADFCLPCKQEFPNLVRMHRHYAAAGLACVSVTIDEAERKQAALKFLESQHATFANYLLNEDPSVWQEKWDIKGVPVVFVFDRQGKLARKFDDDDPDHQFTYADVEKLARELLERK
jgi:thiol-disulfide isomerase/thioredoxin